MRVWLHQILDWITAYYGDKWYLLLTILAYAYLCFASKDSRRRYVYPSVLAAFLIVNPVLYAYVYTKVVYWRLFWLLPNGLAIAYATMLFAKKRKHIWAKIVPVVLVVACVFVKGTNVYTHAGMMPMVNKQKVSVQVQEVCDTMLSLKEKPRCIAAFDLCSEIRQYSGDIELMYGRNAEGYINLLDDLGMHIADEMRSETPDYSYIFAQALAKNYDFVVTETRKEVDRSVLQKYGYTLCTSVDGYNVYYCDAVEQQTIGGWVVTQYGSAWYNTCYTIEDENNNLIVIDGGYAAYEEKLRALIRAHDNHVTAWIVTSPASSCAQAFCNVMEDKQGIRVDKIYSMEITDVQYELFAENAKDWEHPEVCQKLREVLAKEKNVQYVKEDDTFSELGLSFEVLHVWDAETDAIGKNQECNGSMCFTVQGKEEKMLFLSKLYRTMEPYITTRHKAEIDADYVQVNNAGEWAFSDAFYKQVSPRAAFMDCGSDTMKQEDENQLWNTYMSFMNQDIPVYTFDRGPHFIILK